MLNAHQKYIVDKGGRGAIVLNAAAGSGKTTTTKETIARMIESGVDPSKILAVTFTRKASREWQERIGAETIKGWNDLHVKALENEEDHYFLKMSSEEGRVFEFLVSWCTTIHAACYRLLKEGGDRRRIPTTKQEFEIKDLINAILDENGWSKLSYKNAMSIIATGIANRVSVNGFAEMIEPHLERGADVPPNAAEILAEVYDAYLTYMRKKNLLDFNMMTVDTLTRLERNSAFREMATNKFKYIFVDEAQDTSVIQSRILFILAEKNGNILFVGDPRQSIYQWRGAFPEIMEESFGDYWKDYELRSLPINYRSTRAIIDASNEIVALNYQGREQFLMAVEAKPNAKDGKPIAKKKFHDIESMAKFIASIIIDKPEQAFIVSRTNAECQLLHTYLSKEKVRCVNMSGGTLYGSKNVSRLIAYMKLAVDYRNARNNLEVLSEVANIASDTFLSPINKRKHSEFCNETRAWIDCGCPIVLRKGIDRSYTRYYGRKSVERANGWWGIIGQASHTTRGGEHIMYSYGAEDLTYFVQSLEDYRNNAAECMDYILEHSLIPYIMHEEGVDASSDLGEASGLEEFEIVKEFIKEGMTVEEFLTEFDEYDFANGHDEKNSAVIMTVHKSKGLERPLVFINVTRMPCAIPPVFPGQVRIEQSQNPIEERNIFYVAVTRAEDEAYVLQSETWNGKEVATSPFYHEVKGVVYEHGG